LNGLDVIRLFYLAGISLVGQKFEGFGQNDPQNVKLEINTCWEGISLRQTAYVFRATVRQIISIRLACAGAQEKRQEGRQEGRN